jgi:hypothetical protein
MGLIIFIWDHSLSVLKLHEVQLPTNRKFGFFFFAVFAFISIYFVKEDNMPLACLFCLLAGTFFLVTIIKADLLLPFNKLWMNVGLLIGKVISPVVLGVIFFGLFTPIALFMRIAGRDELRLKVTELSSFWKPRPKNYFSSSQFEKQF